MRHVAGIFSRYLNSKRLYIDHISDCNYLIEACSKLFVTLCHAIVNFAISVRVNFKSAERVYFASLFRQERQSFSFSPHFSYF